MLKSMLVNKDFQTWHLIGWRLCCQPIRYQVWKSLLEAMFENPCKLTWNLTWILLNNPRPWAASGVLCYMAARFGTPTISTPTNLERKGRAMLRWMFNNKPNQGVTKQELLQMFHSTVKPAKNKLPTLVWSHTAMARSTGAELSESPGSKGWADPKSHGKRAYKMTGKPGI